MKFSKILLSTVLLSFTVFIVSFTTANSSETTANLPKIKVKWKHGGCVLTGGFCIDVTWNPSFAPLTDNEISDGYGTFNYSVTDNGKMNIIFDGPEATVNGTFPVDDDITIPVQFATAAGKGSIEIIHGVYSVTYSDAHPYGQVSLDCVITN